MSWFKTRVVGNVANLSIFDGIGFGAPVAHLLESIENVPIIELTVNSTGGDGMAAEEVYQAIRGRCRMATIINAHSSAALIAQAADHRRIHHDATLMLHSPSITTFANAHELRQQANSLDQVTAAWIDRLLERTGAPIEQVCSWMAGPDVYLTATEAISVGLADEIYTPPVRERLNGDADSSTSSEEFSPLPGETANSEWFLEFIQAFGPIRCSDKKRFYRELQSHLAMQLSEIDP